MKHAETHPSLDVDGCYGCKISGIQFTGLERMARDRAEGVTQAQRGREVIDAAKRDGRDITRVGKGARWI